MHARTLSQLSIAMLFAVVSPSVGSAEPPGPVGQPGRWETMFADEFDGSALDLERWTTCYWWEDLGCTNLGNKELEWYLSGNVQVADGHLRLTARREEVVGHNKQMFPYTSGMVTTGRYYRERSRAPRFSALYGYFETRAKIPAGKGLWPAFWLLPISHQSKPEIDIMEVLGHRPNRLEMHVHYRDKTGRARSAGRGVTTSNLSEDWHVFGVLWEPKKVTWYLDGVEKWQYTGEGISAEPMYILLNLAVGGNWPGAPDNATKFPADFLIDYVRAWRRLGP